MTPARILLIHGLGESALCFLGLKDALSLRGWEVFVPELPGYGQRRNHPPGSFDTLVTELASYLTAPTVVLGHSMGGVLGTILCVRHQKHVLAFLNVEGNLSLDDCSFSSIAERQTEIEFLKQGCLLTIP
ncbi:MAG: alpha/beta fold hydrolase [Magnetococcales bacterium]|nr:alpha/beta fold hydrolase [Magnetococcales bacterium]